MDIVNIDALIAQGRILDLSNVNENEDYLILGKYSNDYTTNSFKYTNYPVFAIKAKDLIAVSTDGVTITGDGTPGNPLVGAAAAGVQSVTGLYTDNTDPLNPIVRLFTGTGLSGDGTFADPLTAPFQPVSVDGVTITGDGSVGNPLVAAVGTPTLQQVLNFNHDLVNGNNYQGTGAGVGNTGTNVIASGGNAANGNLGSYVVAIGDSAAKNNTAVGSYSVAIGISAGQENNGAEIVAIGVSAGYQNTGTALVAISNSAGLQNTGSDVIAIGQNAASTNNGSTVVAIGVGAAQTNKAPNSIGIGQNALKNNKITAEYVIGIGNGAVEDNEGYLVTALGTSAGYRNKKNYVIALGSQAGAFNNRANSFIVSNSELPTFLDHAAATDPLSATSITVANGAVTGTYLYHNQTTNSIGAVRIP